MEGTRSAQVARNPAPWLVGLVSLVVVAVWTSNPLGRGLVDREELAWALRILPPALLGLVALGAIGWEPASRARAQAAVLAVLPLVGLLVCVVPLWEEGHRADVRLGARIDQLAGLGALLGAAPVALRRQGERALAAGIAMAGALVMAVLGRADLLWGGIGLLAAAGTAAALNLPKNRREVPGVARIRPARGGGGLYLNQEAQRLFGLTEPGPHAIERLVARGTAWDREKLRATLLDLLGGGTRLADHHLDDGEGGYREVLVEGAYGQVELRALSETGVAARARGARRAELAVELMGTAILITDRNGRLVEGGRQMEALAEPWGGIEAWLGAYRTVLAATRRTGHTEPASGGVVSERVTLPLPTGNGRRTYQVRHRLLGETGEELHTVEDVTGEAEAAGHRVEENARLNREVKELRQRQIHDRGILSKLNHELRTPLNVIIGYSEMILEDSPPGDDLLREDIGRILANGHRLRRIVEAVIDHTLTQGRALALAQEPFDLGGVLGELGEKLQGRMETSGNSLRVVSPDGPVQLLGDRARLAQVLEQLLDNAGKFTRQGRVVLAARPIAGDLVEFVVEDSGIGMNQEQLKRIGEPFWQGGTGLAEREGSMGLGFTVVKGIVARMGGGIEVESEPGVGTRVCLTIPRELRAPPPESVGRASRRIAPQDPTWSDADDDPATEEAHHRAVAEDPSEEATFFAGVEGLARSVSQSALAGSGVRRKAPGNGVPER